MYVTTAAPLGMACRCLTSSVISNTGAYATQSSNKKVVVIGAGWGGFGAAHALVKARGVDVLLLDSADDPGGLSGFAGQRTVANRPVEPGIKG